MLGADLGLAPQAVEFRLFEAFEISFQPTSSTICVCVTTAISRPASFVMRVCQAIVRRPLCSGKHSPITLVPAGAGAKKFVFDSMVVVPCPSRKLSTVAHAPKVSANAMIAPPCKVDGVVQSSSRTTSSAVTLILSRADKSHAEQFRKRRNSFL